MFASRQSREVCLIAHKNSHLKSPEPLTLARSLDLVPEEDKGVDLLKLAEQEKYYSVSQRLHELKCLESSAVS